jgi:hypothetical protein
MHAVYEQYIFGVQQTCLPFDRLYSGRRNFDVLKEEHCRPILEDILQEGQAHLQACGAHIERGYP